MYICICSGEISSWCAWRENVNRCVCKYVFTYISYTYVSVCIYVHTHIQRRDVKMARHNFIDVYILIYEYVHICIFICIYMHIFTYTAERCQVGARSTWTAGKSARVPQL